MKRFLIPALILLASRAEAACSIANPSNCFQDPGSIGQDLIVGEYRFEVKNLCSRAVWVAVRHLPQSSDGAVLWEAKGWWKIEPNEKAYLVDTYNKYVYLHARSDDGKINWGDEEHSFLFQDQDLPALEISMGNSFNVFTQELRCDPVLIETAPQS